jgi:hypothetical protein
MTIYHFCGLVLTLGGVDPGFCTCKGFAEADDGKNPVALDCMVFGADVDGGLLDFINGFDAEEVFALLGGGGFGGLGGFAEISSDDDFVDMTL